MCINKYLVDLSISLVRDPKRELNHKSDESSLPAIAKALTAEYERYVVDKQVIVNSYPVYFAGYAKLKKVPPS